MGIMIDTGDNICASIGDKSATLLCNLLELGYATADQIGGQ
jgi:hypothetical protein